MARSELLSLVSLVYVMYDLGSTDALGMSSAAS